MIIIIISIMINYLKNNNNKDIESDFAETEFEKKDIYEPNREIIQVTNKNKYFAVEEILNKYIYFIKEMKGIINFQKYDDIEIRNEGVSKLYNILDSQYLSELDIKKESLQNKIKEYTDYNLKMDKVYIFEETSTINIFFVYFAIDEEPCSVLIKTDSSNMAFSIYLDDYIKKYSYNIDMDINDININNQEISQNEDNQYKYINITDEYMVVQYFNSLKNSFKNNIQYTYNNLMEEEYRDKRFGNIDNFSKYINDNIEMLEDIKPDKYTINNYENYKEYVCIDQYGNYYIFKENAIMDYTFMLDLYTITTEKFKNTYAEANEEKRVQMNIDRFIQMINRHDYKTSYNYISEHRKNSKSI